MTLSRDTAPTVCRITNSASFMEIREFRGKEPSNSDLWKTNSMAPSSHMGLRHRAAMTHFDQADPFFAGGIQGRFVRGIISLIAG